MKVLQKGSGQKGWAGTFACTGEGHEGGGCGAVLLVEEGDLTALASHDMLGDRYGECVRFRCAECGVATDLAPPKIPKSLWRRLWAKQNSDRT